MKTDKSNPPALTLIKNQGVPASPVLTRDFRQNPRLCGDFEDLLELNQHKAHLEKHEAKLRRRIQNAMGKAQKAVFTQGYAQWVKENDRIDLNTQAVLEHFPALLDEFPQIQINTPSFEIHHHTLGVVHEGGEHDD